MHIYYPAYITLCILLLLTRLVKHKVTRRILLGIGLVAALPLPMCIEYGCTVFPLGILFIAVPAKLLCLGA